VNVRAVGVVSFRKQWHAYVVCDVVMLVYHA